MDGKTEQIFIINTSEAQALLGPQSSAETTQPNLQNVLTSNVCRTCAAATEFVIPIFHGEGLQNNLAEKIHKHLPIQVSEQDELPQVVCYQCASTLLAWHELVECCVQADQALRTRLAVGKAAKQQEAQPGTSTEVNEAQTQQQSEDKDKDKEEPANPDTTKRATETEQLLEVTVDENKYIICEFCRKCVSAHSWKRHVRSHVDDRHHRCHLCGLGFNESGNLARHVRAKHQKERPHVCSHCHKTFTRLDHLKDHLSLHSDAREFTCDTCGQSFKSGSALRMHGKMHDTNTKFSCLECGARFKRSGELRAHVSVHTGEKPFVCACGKAFRLRAQLNAHHLTRAKIQAVMDTFIEMSDLVIDFERPAAAAAEEAPSCPYCGAVTGDRAAHTAHLVAAHAELLFHCDECDQYVDRKDLILHMTMHAVQYSLNEKNAQPTREDKQNEPLTAGVQPPEEAGTPVKKQKKVKKKVPSDEEMFKKDVKPVNAESFQKTSETELKSEIPGNNNISKEASDFSDHTDTEDGFGPLPESVFEAIEDSQDSQPETPSESKETRKENKTTTKNKWARACPYCQKIYTASSSYFYHIRYSHKGIKEHECDICKRKFATKASVKQHMVTHNEALPYECSECGKKFRSKASLYIHSQTHGSVKRFICGTCGKGFRWKQLMLRHEQRHAAARNHECGQCGRAFRVRCDMLRHARTHAAEAHACSKCGRQFAQLRYLKVHMDKKHSAASIAAPVHVTPQVHS